MIVGGDLKFRQQVCNLLIRHGFSVRTVHSADLAVEVLKQGWRGVILSSVKLSDTSGWGLAERVRAVDAEVPIILFGAGPPAPSTTHPVPKIQACLPNEVSEEALLNEVNRWLTATPQPKRERRPGTILVVDDEPRCRSILQEFLQLKGFTVLTAASGEEALEQIGRSSPTVVLLDVRMPGMDGLMTLRHIRVSQPNLPVIFISHVDEEPVMEEAAVLGANGYILKPFDFDYLETTLLTQIFT
jgi:DNA-binding response OmpR family regulator